MRIGFDMDEILCDFSNPLVEAINAYFGTSITFNDLKKYRIEENINRTTEEIMPVMHDLHKEHSLINMPALLDGITAINEFKNRGHYVAIITSRYEMFRESTQHWLSKYEVLFDELVMTSHTSKAVPAQERGIQYFVEDNASYANEIAGSGITVFIPKKPWNESEELHHNAIRIQNCSELIEKLL